MSSTEGIKPFFWLWLPPTLLAFQIMMEIMLDKQTLRVIHSEYGPHELVQFLIISIAAFVAFHTLKKMDRGANRWLTFWIGLAAVCCTYVAIEEISWGQTILQWNTPEFWMEINKQKETNLHNTSSWLDQKPRMLLQASVVTGGLVIPFLARCKAQWLPTRFEIIYPPAIMAVTAGTLVIFRLINLVGHHILGFDLFTRANEISELYMFYFVLLYLVIMRQRILKVSGP